MANFIDDDWWFTYLKWWFSIATLNYQRVVIKNHPPTVILKVKAHPQERVWVICGFLVSSPTKPWNSPGCIPSFRYKKDLGFAKRWDSEWDSSWGLFFSFFEWKLMEVIMGLNGVWWDLMGFTDFDRRRCWLVEWKTRPNRFKMI